MTRKLSDLVKDERNIVEEHLESASVRLGLDSYESHGSNTNILKDAIGICHNCKYFSFCRTEFGNINAICERFECRLNGQNRIVECSLHSPRNVMTLNEMYSMAYLIETKDEKVEGFLSTNPKLQKKWRKKV